MTTNLANKAIWDTLAPDELFHFETLEQVPPKHVYTVVKRGFDISISLLSLLILLIPMSLIAVLIISDSPGKPIYTQIRLGKNEKPFRMYKFRSMVTGAEEDGARWAIENDPRVTRMGKWMRKTRIDELPQLLNILLGQMSFVGPRPERPEFYDLFDSYIEGFRQRMMVVPGLTGLAQINGGYDLRPEEKIVYDIAYIKTRSFRVDLRCILKTLLIVFTSEGAR